eukprot:CAMPEP_0170552458 /NCGR_PEP_ID=MMETSP0211-20121228/10343_1 /TAXON_ID=311385 /ORGANISM="Pseudokeronopsis sp., Strain OXSARD2" /LENGTH=80 /DNA_ID=CAMNT_0010860183 /DNA_START=585 /DNA_END=827 /DNA_ORIENTATION=+
MTERWRVLKEDTQMSNISTTRNSFWKMLSPKPKHPEKGAAAWEDSAENHRSNLMEKTSPSSKDSTQAKIWNLTQMKLHPC